MPDAMPPASPGFAAPSPVERLFKRVKAYLDRFKTTVRRYFPIPAGSPVERFAPVAAGYPVFELLAEKATEGHPSSAD